MSGGKGFQLFDNYDDDGQLRLFDADFDDWDEDWEEAEETPIEPMVEEVPAKDSAAEKTKETPAVKQEAKEKNAEEKTAAAQKSAKPATGVSEERYTGPEIRVKYCSSCGKMLFVKEDASGYHSECNRCEIKYFQKAFGVGN